GKRRRHRLGPRRPRACAARRDGAKERPAHRAAELDRRAPCRRLRRSLRPRAPGRARSTSQGRTMTDAQQQQPTFQIEKVYLKDSSLEIPHAPKIFLEQINPQLEVQINTGA